MLLIIVLFSILSLVIASWAFYTSFNVSKTANPNLLSKYTVESIKVFDRMIALYIVLLIIIFDVSCLYFSNATKKNGELQDSDKNFLLIIMIGFVFVSTIYFIIVKNFVLKRKNDGQICNLNIKCESLLFRKFVNDNFNGDIEKALECLAKEGYSNEFNIIKDGAELKRILDNLSKECEGRYYYYLREEIDNNPKRFKKDYRVALMMSSLRMSVEDIKNTKENPFRKKLISGYFILFFAVGLLLIFKFYLPGYFGTAIKLAGVASAFFAPELGMITLKYFRFLYVQNYIKKSELNKN